MKMPTSEKSERNYITFTREIRRKEMRDLLRYIFDNVPNEGRGPNDGVEFRSRCRGNREILDDLFKGTIFDEFAIFREQGSVMAPFAPHRTLSSGPAYSGIRFLHHYLGPHADDLQVVGLVEEVRAATNRYFAEKSSTSSQ